MSDYLQGLESRMAEEEPYVLVWEVEAAFREALTERPQDFDEKARRLHELLRFCKFDALAPWLRDEPGAVHRALEFARRHGEQRVVQILENVLAGKPDPSPRVTVKLPGQAERVLDVDAGEITRFEGRDFGGSDMALSFSLGGFTRAVLREVQAAALAIPPPLAKRQRQKADAQAAGLLAGGASAADLFGRLVMAAQPRMLAGPSKDIDDRCTDRAVALPLLHIVNPPASTQQLATAGQRFGPIAADLLAVYARHNGAELFQFQGEPGFILLPIEQWDEFLGHAIDWATEVTWQEETDQIPSYLHSAIAFGYIPGDSERWLFITEGEHAGKIMLSDTDLINDEPRFSSLAEFFSILLADAARIIGSGGYVRYPNGEDQLFPIRYVDS